MISGDVSMDISPVKKNHNSSSSSTASLEPLRGSWADEVRLANEEEEQMRPTLNNSTESRSSEMKCSPLQKGHLSVSQEREISLEFIEGVNEEKFERLVKDHKLKTPFKRRHSKTPSSGSRSDSPNNSNSDGSGGGGGSGGSGAGERDYRNNSDEAQKRLRYNSYGSASSSTQQKIETDPAVLARRQKQIDYGKNTLAYERYIEMVPRYKRTRDHPHTPYKYGKYSRRTFDGLIKVWRKQLHYYDPKEPEDVDKHADSDDSD